MNHMDPMGWFQQQEQNRKDRLKANDITLLNRELQRLLHEVKHNIDDWKHYHSIANRLGQEYRVVNSSLWDLSWSNNFESEQVVIVQGLLIEHILKNEKLETRNIVYIVIVWMY